MGEVGVVGGDEEDDEYEVMVDLKRLLSHEAKTTRGAHLCRLIVYFVLFICLFIYFLLLFCCLISRFTCGS
jgi:hypothetical protein